MRVLHLNLGQPAEVYLSSASLYDMRLLTYLSRSDHSWRLGSLGGTVDADIKVAILVVAPEVASLCLEVLAAEVAEETYTGHHASMRIAGEGRLPVGERVALLARHTGTGPWLSKLVGLLELAIFGL